MPTSQIPESIRQPSLRLWPGVALVALQWFLWFGLPIFWAESGPVSAGGALLGGLAVVVWWVFFSRAPGVERLGALTLIATSLLVTSRFLHESIATAGMGMLFYIYAAPVICLALVVWAAASRGLPQGFRLGAMAVTILLVCGPWTLVRSGGVRGGGGSDFAWRWAPSSEEQLLATAASSEKTAASSHASGSAAPANASSVGWSGFRGDHRDSILRDVRIDIDWSTSPPAELWRRAIGPGWSSFAVSGDFLYTQEQRGDDELVSCYRVSTGEPVWQHRDAERFWESNAGAGPRATPTLDRGRVYTFGATGILNALDAADGSTVWSRNVVADHDVKVPGWGFSSSPLVVDDVVIVHARVLAAYDLATGEPRWAGPKGGGYSSPHLATIGGVEQVLLLSGAGVLGIAPANGSLLWDHPWTGGIVQPALTEDGDVLVSAGGVTGGLGLRRIAVDQGPGGWTTEERWTSIRLKPNFNDFVVHGGHAYGFDGSILASLDVEDGERNWKGGRYGNGQLLLLADQDLLLVLSEDGELVLVQAAPDAFKEVARQPAIEGKTWNHPVLVDDVLLVRNGEEMAAFRLALAGA